LGNINKKRESKRQKRVLFVLPDGEGKVYECSWRA